jgi:outer membrane protein assembly factor BamC
MKSKIFLFISLPLLLNISACSSVKSIFPDKEKDYQLTSEIPELKIPSDLSDNTPQDNVDIKNTQKEDGRTVSQSFETAPSEIDDKQKPAATDKVKFADGASRIRVEEAIETTWRKVGKALSRHSIEITDRNERDRIYLVQYDPDFKKVEDGSLWDEVLFIFGGDPAQEKEFGIKLIEKKTNTEIFVVDSDEKPLSKGAGLKLLKLLNKTLEEDLPD